MVPVLGMSSATVGQSSEMNHHFSLGGTCLGNPTLPGSKRLLFQVSTARLDNAESLGRKRFLTVVYALLTRGVSMLGKEAQT